MGSSFVLFDVYRNNPRAVSVWEKRLDTKMYLPVGKCYLPMGKRASVTTANIVDLLAVVWPLLL